MQGSHKQRLPQLILGMLNPSLLPYNLCVCQSKLLVFWLLACQYPSVKLSANRGQDFSFFKSQNLLQKRFSKNVYWPKLGWLNYQLIEGKIFHSSSPRIYFRRDSQKMSTELNWVEFILFSEKEATNNNDKYQKKTLKKTLMTLLIEVSLLEVSGNQISVK